MPIDSTNPKKVVLYAANNGELRQLPNKYNKYMDVKDSFGRNPVLISAMKGYLPRLPDAAKKDNLFLERDNTGQNALHLAARYGQLRHIPKNLLTHDNLSVVDKDGNSVYDYVRRFNLKDQLPEGLRANVEIVKKEVFNEVPNFGSLEDAKHLVKNFYNESYNLEALRKFVKAVPEKGKQSGVLYGNSLDPNFESVLADPIGDGAVKFSARSKHEDLGNVDLGIYRREDILGAIKELSKRTPLKALRSIDDSPNVCMR